MTAPEVAGLQRPCIHCPAPDVPVPTPGMIAGVCQLCSQQVPGYECAGCRTVVPVIDLAGKMDGGCRSCGQALPG